MAEVDDGSCIFLKVERIGTYTVVDSVIDPFTVHHSGPYDICIARMHCDPDSLLIQNYAAIKNSAGEAIEVACTIEGDSLFIAKQTILGPDPEATVDFIQVSTSVGYFSGDSIFFTLSYSDRFDPYYGGAEGMMR